MKYRLNTTNYRTFSVFRDRKLPARAYFIPYPDRASADAVGPLEKRYRSEKVLCLNGDWDFKFYPRPAELPEVLDTDAVRFDRIDVPSCWQFRGYDRPFYVNVRYQFPYKPPEIPTDEPVGKVFAWIGGDQGVRPRWTQPTDEYNFVGVYRKKVVIERPELRTEISFLGVASCLDLYCNGAYVGYSEGSHNTAEFDLSGKLTAGENEIVAVVRRWCTGTYLECQDMFRNNGIFRDVLLRISEPTDLLDIAAVTERTETGWKLTLSALTHTDTDLRLTLSGHGLERSETVHTRSCRGKVTFTDLDAETWSAETPVLYEIYYETPTCCVRERIGFRTVEIDGSVFRLNGRAIKLHGVNHHDTSPTNGYSLSPAEIDRDLRHRPRPAPVQGIQYRHCPYLPLSPGPPASGAGGRVRHLSDRRERSGDPRRLGCQAPAELRPHLRRSPLGAALSRPDHQPLPPRQDPFQHLNHPLVPRQRGRRIPQHGLDVRLSQGQLPPARPL